MTKAELEEAYRHAIAADRAASGLTEEDDGTED